MKKYHAILIISLSVLATFGCKKDSSKPTPEKEVPKLEGNWKVSYWVYDNYAGTILLIATLWKKQPIPKQPLMRIEPDHLLLMAMKRQVSTTRLPRAN